MLLRRGASLNFEAHFMAKLLPAAIYKIYVCNSSLSRLLWDGEDASLHAHADRNVFRHACVLHGA